MCININAGIPVDDVIRRDSYVTAVTSSVTHSFGGGGHFAFCAFVIEEIRLIDAVIIENHS